MEFDKAEPLNRLIMVILEEHPEGLTESELYDEYVARLEEFYTWSFAYGRLGFLLGVGNLPRNRRDFVRFFNFTE